MYDTSQRALPGDISPSASDLEDPSMFVTARGERTTRRRVEGGSADQVRSTLSDARIEQEARTAVTDEAVPPARDNGGRPVLEPGGHLPNPEQNEAEIYRSQPRLDATVRVDTPQPDRRRSPSILIPETKTGSTISDSNLKYYAPR